MTNIWGYKNKLKKSRDFLKHAEQKLNDEKRKKGMRRDDRKIEWWEKHIKDIKAGQQNLRDKIKNLKQVRKKKKK